MFFDLFGKYLVCNNKMTKEQFDDIKESQASTRVKLGLIAVSEKMITEKQADEINRKQAVMDKRFGDIAVELGYLTDDQVGKLLSLQGNSYMVFCQLVTDKGIMTLPEIEESLKKYGDELGISDSQLEDIKSDDIDRIIPIFVPAVDSKYTELMAVAIRTINRLISSNLSIDKGYVVDSLDISGYACQALEGDFNVRTGFVGEGDSLLVIADSYAREKFEQVDEDALDSVGEFINIINGLYATALSYDKVNVELMPPSLVTDNVVVNASKVCVMPITIDGNDVKLFLAID